MERLLRRSHSVRATAEFPCCRVQPAWTARSWFKALKPLCFGWYLGSLGGLPQIFSGHVVAGQEVVDRLAELGPWRLAKLMTPELVATLCEHAQGNPRALMNIAAELPDVAAQREVRTIDEKLFLEMCAAPPARRARAGMGEVHLMSALTIEWRDGSSIKRRDLLSPKFPDQ